MSLDPKNLDEVEAWAKRISKESQALWHDFNTVELSEAIGSILSQVREKRA